jgi:hypothetical protein
MRTVLALGRGSAGLRGSSGCRSSSSRGSTRCSCSGSSSSSSSTTSTAHKRRDRSTSINSTATLCAAKSRRFATHLTSTDDGGIGLGAALRSGAVTGSSILDCIALAMFREEEGGSAYQRDRA